MKVQACLPLVTVSPRFEKSETSQKRRVFRVEKEPRFRFIIRGNEFPTTFFPSREGKRIRYN